MSIGLCNQIICVEKKFENEENSIFKTQQLIF